MKCVGASMAQVPCIPTHVEFLWLSLLITLLVGVWATKESSFVIVVA